MNHEAIKRSVADAFAGGMTCKILVERVSDALEGALSLSDQLRFHMHLTMCPGCRRYLRQTKCTIATLRGLPSPSIAPDVRDALIRRFRMWSAHTPS